MAKEEIKELAAVEAAEQKVDQIKAEKLAKKMAKQQARLENWRFKTPARIINGVENHPVIATVTAALGPAGFALGWFGKSIYDAHKAKTEVEEISDEAVEAPFDE